MKLLEACEYAKKSGAETVGDAILCVENNAHRLFKVDVMAIELSELVSDSIGVSDDMLIDDYLKEDN